MLSGERNAGKYSKSKDPNLVREQYAFLQLLARCLPKVLCSDLWQCRVHFICYRRRIIYPECFVAKPATHLPFGIIYKACIFTTQSSCRSHWSSISSRPLPPPAAVQRQKSVDLLSAFGRIEAMLLLPLQVVSTQWRCKPRQ